VKVRVILYDLYMRITSKGQVTVPIELREEFDLASGSTVEFSASKDGILLRKSEESQSRGKQLVDRLRGAGSVRMSTDEILDLTRE